MSGISVGLNCPVCGGAISVEEGESTINCQYCGSLLYVEGDSGVTTIAFKNKVTKDAAIAATEQWWRKGFKARDLKKTGKVLEVYPIYLPFWNTTVRVAGWICGYEERTHSDGKGHTHTEKVPKEKMVLEDYAFSEIASDPGDLGLKKLRNMNGETAFTDFEMIPTYQATTSRDDATEHARQEGIVRARGDAGVPHITFESIHTFPRRMSLIYYPVWVIRYNYREKMYISTVDGVTGSVLSGRGPGDPLYQALAVTAGTSIGGLIAAGGMLMGAQGEGTVAVVGLVVGVILLVVTYMFFRHGSEIIEGDFTDKKYGLNIDSDLLNVAKQIKLG
jgi:hypothetical protein